MKTKQMTLEGTEYHNATCKNCGKPYFRIHGLQKYCSKECREKAIIKQKYKSYYKLRGKYINRQTKCKYCGKQFIKKHNRQQYCSTDCQIKAKQDQTAKSQQKRRKLIREGYLITNENEYVGTGYLSKHRHENEEKEYHAIIKEMTRLRLRPKIYL